MSVGYPPREFERVRTALQARSSARGGTAVDLYRNGGHLVLNADLPGIDPGSLTVELNGNTLLIRAHRTLRGMDGGARWDVRDREDGPILRSILIGEGIDAGAISPHYADGVLSLHIPVTAGSRQRNVPVVFAPEHGCPQERRPPAA